MIHYLKNRSPIFDAVLVLISTFAALILAQNTAIWSIISDFIYNTYLIKSFDGIFPGILNITKGITVEKFINDFLVSVFFLMMGIKVKKEVLDGDLANPRQAALPIIASCGGMIIPIALYLLVMNLTGANPQETRGWGIPMTTDIVFAIMMLDLAAKRVPRSLKVFLITSTVIDDIGAMVVIIIISGVASLNFAWILMALVFLALLALMNYCRVNNLPAYLFVGLLMLIACFFSGVHPTIAGLLLGLALPAKMLAATRRGRAQLARQNPDTAPTPKLSPPPTLIDPNSTMSRCYHLFEPISAILVVPIFSFANSGVEMSGAAISAALSSPIAWGIAAGLLIGKPLGIFSFSLLAVKTKLATLHRSLNWNYLFAVSIVTGIGFKLAMVLARLAFGVASENLYHARMSIILCGVLMAIIGQIYLFRLPELDPSESVAGTNIHD